MLMPALQLVTETGRGGLSRPPAWTQRRRLVAAKQAPHVLVKTP